MATPRTPQEYRESGHSPAESDRVLIKKLDLRKITVKIEGVTPIVTHAWTEKAKRMMLEAQQGGKRVKLREKRDPEAEFNAARYPLNDGTDGYPAIGIKAAIVDAAHKDLGIPKNAVQRSLFLEGDVGDLVRIITPNPPLMREDIVRIGMGSADLRYRPQYEPWSMQLRMIYDADALNAETIFNLLERAGFGGGLGEYRPQTGGDWGRFRVAREE